MKSFHFSVWLVLLTVWLVGKYVRVDYGDPDYNDPSLAGMVRRQGYLLEEHDVKSKDNEYLLRLIRIPGRIEGDKEKSERFPIILFPCFLCPSSMFTLDFRNVSLGYVLSDAGFDVWVGNYRGTDYGNRFVNGSHIDMGNPDHWRHSVYEYAMYDVSAQIDYILNATGYKRIFVIGYSQGSNVILTLCSLQPEYNDKIVAFAGLAPFRTLRHLTNRMYTMAFGALLSPVGQYLVSTFNQQRFLPMFPYWVISIPGHTCAGLNTNFQFLYGSPGAMLDFGVNSLKHVFGPLLPEQNLCNWVANNVFSTGLYLNVSRIQVYLQHVPCGSSMNNVEYFEQLRVFSQDNVTALDYTQLKKPLTTAENIRHYGQERPPVYDPKNIRLRIRYYYSTADDFVPPQEIEEVKAALVNSEDMGSWVTTDSGFTHVSFLFHDGSFSFGKDLVTYFSNMKHSFKHEFYETDL